MLGQNAFGTATASPSAGRVFVYEVTGLRQSDATDQNGYPIRSSDSTFIKVPYGRMNQEMQRVYPHGGHHRQH